MTDIAIPGMEPNPPKKEWRLIAGIFGVLLVLIAIPLLRWRHHESQRPILAEIRIVAATEQDPVFREGARTVHSEEPVSLAIALRLEYPGKGSRWLAPVDQLELGGTLVDHVHAESWPERDRTARTFWFTLEGPFLGGVINAEEAQEKLAARPFLAPELGQSFLAQGEPSFHAADSINLGDTLLPVRAGTYRVYARIEVVADAGSSRPLFAATSLGADHLNEPAMVRISRDLEEKFAGIHPAAGHVFRLPGFEPASVEGWNPVDACSRLIATSSRTFAAMATTGQCSTNGLEFDPLGHFSVTDSAVTSTLRWQTDVRPGDLLKQDNHWLVVVSDNGNGILDGPDMVAHSWRRPPSILPLSSALDKAPAEVGVFRIAGP